MTRIQAPADLPELVKAAFTKACTNSDLHYFPTQVSLLNINSVPFQLRFSPALANKPKGPPKDTTKPQKPFDPFADPPPALRITDLGPAHFLVLNKFAVVPEHFILATTRFEEQTDVLDAGDLGATLACIRAYGEPSSASEGGEQQGLFAFFNCGEHSGASQPHRHIQLLPIARMKDGLEGESSSSGWDVMIDRLDVHKPPFVIFSEDIRTDMSSEELHQAYLRLYKQAVRACGGVSEEEIPSDGKALISYNMAMTKSKLALMPRKAGGAQFPVAGDREFGYAELNGTVLAGTALVKNEWEWEALKKDAAGLVTVLRAIGIPQ